MNTALKVINKRVKELQKKHPNSKRSTLQKQAGREWRSGSLKHRKKTYKKIAKVGAVKRRRVTVKRRKIRRSKPKSLAVVRTRTRTRVKTVVRRVGGSGKKSLMPLVIGGLALGALYLFTRNRQTQTPVLIQTANPQRNNWAQNAVAIAQAAGMTAAAIAALIRQLNNSDDTQVQQISQNVQAGNYSDFQGD